MTEELVQKALDGDRRALPRLFTLLERDPLSCGEIMKSIHPLTGKAHCVGVTGPPGAGKSTLVDGLVRLYREAGVSVGVLAVDPTSPFTGGAVLGDRVRMRRHYLDEGVFIRSIATRGWHGGLSLGASAAARLLDAFGMDVVIVESVGVGQTELDIMNVADTVVVVLVPEAGDAVQMLKAGLMEAADIFVVNKADRPNADSMAAVIGAEVAHGSAGAWWTPPVLMTKAHRAQGLQELSEAIAGHLDRSRSTVQPGAPPRRAPPRGVHTAAAWRTGAEAVERRLRGRRDRPPRRGRSERADRPLLCRPRRDRRLGPLPLPPAARGLSLSKGWGVLESEELSTPLSQP